MPNAIPLGQKIVTKGTRLFKSKRAVGVEVEMSNWGDSWYAIGNLPSNIYTTLSPRKDFDSSVRPSEHELVVGPFRGNAMIRSLYLMGELLNKHRAKVNESCSLHVHVDARDLSMWQLRSLVLGYAAHEEAFNMMFPIKRIYNPSMHHGGFSKPMAKDFRCMLNSLGGAKTTADIKKALIKGLYGVIDSPAYADDVCRKKGNKYEACRYYGMNLHAFMFQGTIEFRQHEGCLDEGILLWPAFCATYVDHISTVKPTVLPFDAFVAKYFPSYLVDWKKIRTSRFAGAWTKWANSRNKVEEQRKANSVRWVEDEVARTRTAAVGTQANPPPRPILRHLLVPPPQPLTANYTVQAEVPPLPMPTSPAEMAAQLNILNARQEQENDRLREEQAGVEEEERENDEIVERIGGGREWE